MNTKGLKRYLGDKAFYKMLFALILPMVIQQGITNFVSLLDNVMVGSLGTLQMSGVSIVNQLIFVFNLSLFGALSGVSIFGAQFYGQGDQQGMRHTVRIKLYFGVGILAAALVLFGCKGPELAGLFLSEEANDPAALAETLGYAMDYLRVAVWGLPPFMVVQVYSGTLRETGETKAAMNAGLLAIVVNLVGNYLLIFGKFGFPQMGVAGAALATVASRWVEMAYLVRFTHKNTARFPFMQGVYRSWRVPARLLQKVIVTGLPLLANEVLWSVGTTFVNQNYSTRGLTVVAASNIATTAWQLFCVIMFAMGNAISILVGQKLGAGDIDGAKAMDDKLLFFTTASHVAIGLLIIAAAPFIPYLYNTEPEVRTLATHLLMVQGASLPIHAFLHGAYFTIRSGGKTVVTFFFDSGYTWLLPVPLSFALCRYTALPMVAVYAIVQFSDIVKLFVAVPLLRGGSWAQNLVGGADSAGARD